MLHKSPAPTHGLTPEQQGGSPEPCRVLSQERGKEMPSPSSRPCIRLLKWGKACPRVWGNSNAEQELTAGLRHIKREQKSSQPQDLTSHPICLGGHQPGQHPASPQELWGGSRLPCQADPPAALPPVPGLGLRLGQGCPLAEGDLPESHQANLQGSVQIRVPLRGQGEAARRWGGQGGKVPVPQWGASTVTS